MTEYSVARLECVGGPLDGEEVACAGPEFLVPSRVRFFPAYSLVRLDSKPVALPRHRYRLAMFGKTWSGDDGRVVGLDGQRVYRYIGVED